MPLSIPSAVQLTWDRTPSRWIASPLNYPGGKHRLLSALFSHFPPSIATFYDAFAGGGTVSLNVPAERLVAIDVIPDLVHTMQIMQDLGAEPFIARIQHLSAQYGLVGSVTDLPESQRSPDALARHNAAPYRALRAAFNDPHRTWDPIDRAVWWYTLVLYGFNNQIRTNQRGAWNTPVGKSGLNPLLITRLTLFIDQLRARPIRWHCGHYQDILQWPLTERDFVYCDPPYSISTAVYNSGWTAQDDQALFAFCDTLHARRIRWAVSNVFSHHGRTNDALIAWAQQYTVYTLNISYANASYHHAANSRLPSQEVLITNGASF